MSLTEAQAKHSMPPWGLLNEAQLDEIPDLLLALSPAGVLLAANRSFESLTGFSRESWLGKSIQPLIHRDDWDHAALAIAQSGPGHNIQFEVRFRAREDQYVDFEIVASCHTVPDGTTKVIGIGRDVTSRKKVENQLTQQRKDLESAVRDSTLELLRTNRELKRSNQELEQFAYVVSHDIQEPQRAIATYSELLVKELGSSLSEDAREYLRYITEGVMRTQVLIRDLLEYSRVSRRRAPMEAVDTQATVEQVMSTLSVVTAQSHARITVDKLPVVRGNPQQILRLFQNLLSNALKFRRQGIEPILHVSAKPSSRHWLFSISDNGPGIDQKHHERIFLLFQRLCTRDEFPGSGVGLSICKRIIEQHDGRIWVESAEGAGSTFFFTLPATDGASEIAESNDSV